MHSDFRWKQRFENYQSSLVELREAVSIENPSKVERAGLIQLFEISFELAWKTLKDLLFYEGYDVNSPRSSLRQAFAAGIITDGELWLRALDDRNLTTHTYNEEKAQHAIENIKEKYAPLLVELERELKGRL